MSRSHRPLLLSAIICLLCSLVCFWCFDGRALSNEAMDGYVPASSAIGSAVQFAVCAVAGWQIGEKRPSSASRHHFPAFRWVFWQSSICCSRLFDGMFRTGSCTLASPIRS